MNDNPADNAGLIRGDRFTGLSIADESARVHRFELDGQIIEIRQTPQHPARNITQLELLFAMDRPARFRIDMLVPTDCRNACISLNGQMLVGWFAPNPPENLPGIAISPCQEHGESESTLKPGQFQSVNFRWQDQDRLCYYWVR